MMKRDSENAFAICSQKRTERSKMASKGLGMRVDGPKMVKWAGWDGGQPKVNIASALSDNEKIVQFVAELNISIIIFIL